MPEQIVAKIEAISHCGQDRLKPPHPEPAFSSEEKTEQLWGLFNEYSSFRRQFYRQTLKSKLGERGISELTPPERDSARKELAEHPLVQKLEGEISKLWKDPQVKSIFQTKLKEAVAEQKYHAPSLLRYRKLRQRDATLREEYFDLMRNQFLLRQMTPTLRGLEIARNRVERQTIKEELKKLEQNGGMMEDLVRVRGGLDNEHADLAALLAFEQIQDYHRQFREEGFVRTPSRKELLEEVLTKTANGTWMLLIGETGTGKTRFAEMVSLVLNGEPPLYASGEERGDVTRLIGTKSMTGEGKTYYDFGPLVASFTGWTNSLDMERGGSSPKGHILVLDELNKFNQEALFGSLKTAHNLRPGKKFNYKELPGIVLQMTESGTAVIATMNPATIRYERKELDPALERLLADGKRTVNYLPMSAENPELYEIFLAILMDDNGRIRIPKDELAPVYVESKDEAKGIITRKLVSDSKQHGALYRFALAASEIHKSFSQKENVAKTAIDEGFLEKTVLDMGVLVDWMKAYHTEIEGGDSLTNYLGKKLHGFYKNIDSENDRAIFKRIFSHFGFDIENPSRIPKSSYQILTPVEIGYLTPRTRQAVVKIGEEVAPQTKIFVLDDGTEIQYLPTSLEITTGKTLEPETIVTYNGRDYRFLGVDPKTGEACYVSYFF